MHDAACTRHGAQRTPRASDVFERQLPLKPREIHRDKVDPLARHDVRLKPPAPADIENSRGRLAPQDRADDRERRIDMPAGAAAGYDDVHNSFTILLKSRPRSS